MLDLLLFAGSEGSLVQHEPLRPPAEEGGSPSSGWNKSQFRKSRQRLVLIRVELHSREPEGGIQEEANVHTHLSDCG